MASFGQNVLISDNTWKVSDKTCRFQIKRGGSDKKWRYNSYKQQWSSLQKWYFLYILQGIVSIYFWRLRIEPRWNSLNFKLGDTNNINDSSIFLNFHTCTMHVPLKLVIYKRGHFLRNSIRAIHLFFKSESMKPYNFLKFRHS